MIKTFEEFDLERKIIDNLETAGIKNPTEIQVHSIPPILEGKDVIGKAKTGTGKTLAYLLPMIKK